MKLRSRAQCIWNLLLVIPFLLLVTVSNAQDGVTLYWAENSPGGLVGSIGSSILVLQGLDASVNGYPGLTSSNFFAIDSNGNVIALREVDRELVQSFYFVVFDNSLYQNFPVTIVITDVNDNTPAFSEPTLLLTIPENTSPGSQIAVLGSATDADEGTNSTQRYELVNGAPLFKVITNEIADSKQAVLKLNGTLDYESQQSYTLEVRAYDGPGLYGTLQVTINVQDINDEVPMFDTSAYSATVYENATIGLEVIEVHAEDDEAGAFGQVFYELSGENASPNYQHFAVDRTSGKITVQHQLDFSSQSLYRLQVRAMNPDADDSGTRKFSQAVVTINVLNVNNIEPEITLHYINGQSIPENTYVDTPLVRVSLDDPDEDTGNFSVFLSDAPPGLFRVSQQNRHTFFIVLNSLLDRETNPRPNITVTGWDTGFPPLNKTVIVSLEVTDINDNQPQFNASTFTLEVAESSPSGTPVGIVTAIDRDEGINAVITYSIEDLPNSETTGWFTVLNATGMIQTANERIDCESSSAPQFYLVARDNGEPSLSSRTLVTVNIRTVDDNQPIFDNSFYSVTKSESLDIGQLVIVVTASDYNCGENSAVTYSLSQPGVQAPPQFTINSATGEISLIQRLDYEDKKFHEFPAYATDTGGQTGTVNIRVTVTDANDNKPVFYPVTYSANVRPDQVSQQIVIVLATDRDEGTNGEISFSIVDGNQQNYFAIASNTGSITLRETIPQQAPDLYYLSIRAADGPGLASDVNANVTIRYLRDDYQAPLFGQTFYQFAVDENSINRRVQAVQATVQGSTSGITYSIFSGNINGYFTIVSNTGEIFTTNTPANHEVVPYVVLNVQAEKDGRFGNTQVNISISDVNDNSPLFSSFSPVVDIPENQTVGLAFYTVEATDADSNDNGRIRYSLILNPNDKFQIDSVGGQLSVKNALDYNTRNEYVIRIRAADSATPPRASSLSVTIRVADVNDHTPVCTQTLFDMSIDESENPPSVFGTVVATDEDAGQNSKIVYQIEGEQPEFGIYPSTGEVYNKLSFSHQERRDAVSFRVIARDSGEVPRSTICNVRVYIRDVNDNTPQFTESSYRWNISENAREGAQIGRVQATDIDMDENSRLHYQLIGTSTFIVDESSGHISLAAPLDRETVERYEFGAVARDSGSPSPLTAEARITILVSDINDNAPIFGGLESGVIPAAINENKEPGTWVVQVTAVDPDSGLNGDVSYSIISPTEGSDFSIDSTSGWIQSERTLDRENQSLYNITVKAEDSGLNPMSSTAVVSIHVLDQNEAPVFTASYPTIDVYENVPVGQKVGEVLAQDVDSGENGRIEYIVIKSSEGNVFDVNGTTGAIYPTLTVDYEQMPYHWLTVEARDRSPTSPQGTIINVTITVIDVNDNRPEFPSDPIRIHINENIDIGTSVVQVSANDRDSGVNGMVLYEIASQYPDLPPNMFSINPSTGWIHTSSPIDYEATTGMFLVIRATDQALDESRRLRSTMTVVVNVEDINDNTPQFESRDALSVAEDEPVGYPLLLVRAKDADKNNSIRYSVVSGNADRKFSLNRDTGELVLSETLDREQKDVYELTVSATDTGTPRNQATQTITITVTDINDNPPVFTNKTYITSIPESAQPNTPVQQIVANDADIGENGRLLYLIPFGLADNKFAIDSTGLITTNGLLDRENVSEYSFSAYVHDSAYPALYDFCTVQVTINDVNDNTPFFQHEAFYQTVPENLNDRNTSLFQVVAQDLDAGLNSQLKYSIIAGNELNQFSVDENNGKIYAQSLDRETTERYQLTIEARDLGSPSRSNTTRVIITVSDTNDNDPEFTQPRDYEVKINETVSAGTPILTVTARDIDKGNNSQISYFISNNGTDGKFVINMVTGVISTSRTNGHFDREKQPSYRFEVTAQDNAQYDPRTKQTWVEVTITDVNDNPPVFTDVPFIANATTVTQPGQQILQLRATDRDQGDNAQITYELVTQSVYFKVSPAGALEIKASGFNEETYDLTIRATDGGVPPLSSDGYVQVHVGPTGQQNFKFSSSIYMVSLNENAGLDDEVTQVQATLTSGAVSAVTYRLSADTASDPFKIDSSDGRIRVADPNLIDYEEVKRYRVVVVAASSDYSLNDYCTVLIDINDVNDNSPVFNQERYHGMIGEQDNVTSYMLQVQATDRDGGENGQIEYSLEGTNAPFFHVGPTTGIIRLARKLDRETDGVQIRVTIRAIDRGTPPRTGTASLRVTVLDSNDNPPTFTNLNQHTIDNPIDINEDMEVGEQVFVVSALDKDTTPEVQFDFTPGGNPDATFNIDHFSGRISLAKKIDHEVMSQYRLELIANDTVNTVTGELYVNVEDENDNPPIFNQSSYEVYLKEQTPQDVELLSVTATDRDSGENGRVTYSLEGTLSDQFYVNVDTGAIYSRESIQYTEPTILLAIRAADHGDPVLTALVFVQLHIEDINNFAPVFNTIHAQSVSEDEALGIKLFDVTAVDQDDSEENRRVSYSIISGDPEGVFLIDTNTGSVELRSSLDRETTDGYLLVIMAQDGGSPPKNSTVQVPVTVLDANDWKPTFENTQAAMDSVTNTPLIIVSVAEDIPSGSWITKVNATDRDIGDNGKIDFMITSGNDNSLFTMNQTTGVIKLSPDKNLDYDTKTSHRLQIRATDNSVPRQSALATLLVNVSDVNDNHPAFRRWVYLETVAEEQAIGTHVFTAQAVDKDAGRYGVLTYEILGDPTNNFKINENTGDVTTAKVFDYTQVSRYSFNISAYDGDFKAYIQVSVTITSRDSHEPKFSSPLYEFGFDAKTADRGYRIGQVFADDLDHGEDGVVVFTLLNRSYHFLVTKDEGAIYVQNKLTEPDPSTKRPAEARTQLQIQASSGKPDSRTSVALVNIDITGLPNTANISSENDSFGTLEIAIIAVCAVVIVIIVVVVLVVCMVRKRRGIAKNRPTLDISNGIGVGLDATYHRGQLMGPPPYGSYPAYIPPLHGGDISDRSQCGHSSGRGSADFDEEGDEEITAINTVPLHVQNRAKMMPDSGIQRDVDNVSELSAPRDHQEYLARLGIDPNSIGGKAAGLSESVESMHQFSDEGGGEADPIDISNIYTKLGSNNPPPSLPVSNNSIDNSMGFGEAPAATTSASLSSVTDAAEEFTGSYNWDYLLDWGPQYQPLADVFAEIARLKDDTIQPKRKPVQTIPQGGLRNLTGPQQMKMGGPPPIITGTPPRVDSARGNPSQPNNLSSAQTSQLTSMISLPRSPISHESSFSNLAAFTPNFTPALSPLAVTRSPSVSTIQSGGSSRQGGSSTSRSLSRQNRGPPIQEYPNQHEFQI